MWLFFQITVKSWLQALGLYNFRKEFRAGLKMGAAYIRVAYKRRKNQTLRRNAFKPTLKEVRHVWRILKNSANFFKFAVHNPS